MGQRWEKGGCKSEGGKGGTEINEKGRRMN